MNANNIRTKISLKIAKDIFKQYPYDRKYVIDNS